MYNYVFICKGDIIMKPHALNNLTKKIKTMEHDYISQFSSSKETDSTITYRDPTIKDMYTHNFTLYKDISTIIEDTTNAINHGQSSFYRIETYHDVSRLDLTTLPVLPSITTYDFYHIDSSLYHTLQETQDCTVVKATTTKHFADGLSVDIEANAPTMGHEFARRRINRKKTVYTNPNAQIDFYVCYYKGIPVGNIEYAYNDTTVKLEDFDILPKYQRMGLGRTVLKQLLKRAHDNHIKDVYLMTDSAESAKTMYQKCGFKKVLQKSEMFFQLTKT